MSPTSGRFPVPPVDDRPLYDLRQSKTLASVLTLAQEIGLFEYLAERPATRRELARHYQVIPRAAEAIVAVAAAAGYLQNCAAEKIALTDLGRTYLLRTSPFYSEIEPDSETHYELLKEAFYRGDDEDSGKRLAVELGDKSEAEIKDFIDLMHRLTLPAAGGLARQHIFERIGKLLDVAAGSGSLAAAIADYNPHIRCTLLDFAPVCALARKNIASFGLEEQISTVAADMFCDPWPAGHDALLFGNIFHDWDVESCLQLARNAYEVLEPGGYILLHEMPLNESRDGPLCVACFSASMLIFEKGKQYTLSEFEALLSQAGFVDFHSVPSYGYYHLISARRM